MKLKNKIFIYAAVIVAVTAALSSCEKAYYEDEMYRKEVYIVSGENNIFGQEFSFGGDTGYISIYAGGTTEIDEDVTVEIGKDYEAIGQYNIRNYDQSYDQYLEELPADYYTMESTAVTIHAGSEMPYATLPIEVNIDELLVDYSYAIPLRIESVSNYMASHTKDFVLMRIYMKNDYATTKTSTFYTMNGSSLEGVMHNDNFVPTKLNQPIAATKLLVPVGKRSVRMMPGGKSSEKAEEIRNWAVTVTVDPLQTVDVYELDRDGNPTENFNTYQRVFVKPWLTSLDAVNLRDIPEKPSYYDDDKKAFVLHYRYNIPQDEGKAWFEISETLLNNRI